MLMTLPWSRHKLHCTPEVQRRCRGGAEEVERRCRGGAEAVQGRGSGEAAAGERPMPMAEFMAAAACDQGGCGEPRPGRLWRPAARTVHDAEEIARA